MSEKGSERSKLSKDDILAQISKPNSEGSSRDNKKDDKNDLKPPSSMVMSGVKWKIDYNAKGKWAMKAETAKRMASWNGALEGQRSWR